MPLPFDSEKLRFFVPLSELTPENFRELVRHVNIESLPAGSKLFNRGDQDNMTVYLLGGEVELMDGNGNITTLSSRSQQCRFPLDHNRPRQKSATSKTDIHFFRINNDLLDVLLTWDQNKGYIVNEINESNEIDDTETDWMTKILHSSIFHKIPPANIQTIFQRMHAMPVKKGETIITQNETGDYYYMIKNGKCAVYRNASDTGNKEVKIAELKAGQGFGEEALVSDAPRNATVIMESDGVLMRLSKNDFLELLNAPVLKKVNYDEAVEMVQHGAIWLDVRLLSEHQNKKIPGSMNIPLVLLRLNANKLSQDRQYIVYCDTGSRSASATYILNERGYDAYLLDGGLINTPIVNEESAA